jgi:glycosidase
MRQALPLLVLTLVACATEPAATPPVPDLGVPAWAADAVWYQVFVERFRNGDPTNDPTPADIAAFTADAIPEGWAVMPWGHDWYAQVPWERATGRDFYGTVQFRRYGGDLQGLLDKLDDLQDLGITALYLNPINDAPSLHKYDARSYQHVDRTFGPDPRGDGAIMAGETPADPATWRWTSADSLFLRVIDAVHAHGMRIILDYSWNHTGTAFWAWQDVLARQRESPYADWYTIAAFDDPATPDTNEFRYRGWLGVPSLPEWRKVGRPDGQDHGPIEGTLVPPVRDLVFAVSRRWLDPNGDGDPSDGVDGFRLDVADMIPLGFWREYRRFVRGLNPEAYLVGEVWWDEWPDRMWDPAPWLQGDVFDAVMHYQWYAPARQFFAGAPPALTATQYARALDSLGNGFDSAHLRAMMNLTASHDSPRFGTSLYNPGKYKYRVTPRDNPDYRIDRPDARARELQRMILVQQFTWIGAPHIWMGDEVGMWGADDPDPRKPMVWGDLAYEDEVADPFGRARRRDAVAPDSALRRTYQQVITMRRGNARVFADGAVEWLLTDDARRLLAYARVLDDTRAIVAFNAGDAPASVALHAAPGTYRALFPAGPPIRTDDDTLRTTLPPHTAAVWIRP